MRACRPAGNRPAGRRLSFSHFAARASPAFPLGGRRHGKAVTDEGADFGLGLLYTGGFRRPGGELLSARADCQVKCNGLWKKSSRGDFQPRHMYNDQSEDYVKSREDIEFEVQAVTEMMQDHGYSQEEIDAYIQQMKADYAR